MEWPSKHKLSFMKKTTNELSIWKKIWVCSGHITSHLVLHFYYSYLFAFSFIMLDCWWLWTQCMVIRYTIRTQCCISPAIKRTRWLMSCILSIFLADSSRSHAKCLFIRAFMSNYPAKIKLMTSNSAIDIRWLSVVENCTLNLFGRRYNFIV